MNKYKIIALIGESGSGKDAMLKEFMSQYPECHKIVTSTSRPPRENEIDGIHYHFHDTYGLYTKIIEGLTIENTSFNDWFYATCFSDLDEDKINIGVFNPAAVQQLKKRNDCETLIVYVRVPDKERLLRQLNREVDPNVEEIVRRATADFNDFKGIELKVDLLAMPNSTIHDLRSAPRVIMSAFEAQLAEGQN